MVVQVEIESGWRGVLPGVWLFRDSCNVYAIEGPAGVLVIDAGTGAWLDHLDELPGPVAALALTHYFRDHAAGAVAAASRGIPVFVPEGDSGILAEPVEHVRARETYNIYDNIWDLFVPIEPTRIAGVLRDYEKTSLVGLEVHVIPLPGVTPTQVGLGVKLPGTDDHLIFSAEAISAPGKMARVAPLQYNYNDLQGSANAYWSALQLRRLSPVALLPSLGTPILSGVDGALAALMESLREIGGVYRGVTGAFDAAETDDLVRVTDHVWLSTVGRACTWFLISERGKAMCIDYGYAWQNTRWPAYPSPTRRRALLHGLDGLKRRFEIDRIDTVLLSHFHDDHVCGVPLLQRLFGTRCVAPENFADLISQPHAHRFPCNWPTPIRVDRRLPLDRPFEWEEFTFTFAPMSGHTRFAALIGFEADGKRFAHTGDQYAFRVSTDDFTSNMLGPNHVYANGSLLDGYDQSGRWLSSWRPEIVLTGHNKAVQTNAAFFERINEWSELYRHAHERLLQLDDNQPHFNVDGWAAWVWPYRLHLQNPAPASVRVTARNPLARVAELHLRLVGPAGWIGSEAVVSAGSRAEIACELTITPDAPCQRQPFAVELIVEGQRYGQVAEGQITVGGDRF
jgi:glyoxylase-like metal-dependent hydrolase (beta-lactamase superfamily II)